MHFRKLPSRTVLEERFTYDPVTGLLRWRRKGRGRHQGNIAGSINTRGYRVVLVAPGQTARAARVIWKLMTGRDPGCLEVDHQNRVKHDDRWVNLRIAERWQQTANTKLNRRNTSGHRGVYQRPSGRWCAQIRAGKKTRLLGTYDTREEAAAVYQKAAKLLHAEFGVSWGDAKHSWEEAA